MAIPDSEPRLLTLDADGYGTETFRAQRIGNLVKIIKITIETFVTSSGIVAIYRDSQLVTASPLAPLMTAVGQGLELHAGQQITVEVSQGPNSQRIRIIMHFEEVSAWA